MQALRTTISQAVILVVIGLAIGLAVNPVRGKNHINLQRDYRPKVPTVAQADTPAADPSPVDEAGQAEPAPLPRETEASSTSADADASIEAAAEEASDESSRDEVGEATATLQRTQQPAEPAGPTQEHPFKVVNLQDVIKIFNDEKTQWGAHRFVDARADHPYEAGHIPGALQCDYYRLDYYLMDTLSQVYGADKIVVYCNGGDCEDSLYVCGELLNSEIPWDNIYLFKGGWEAWNDSGMPIETGRSDED